MQLNNLSFSALPEISIPFRYFLTAPIFVLALAVYLLVAEPQIWLSRWHPATLMLTHGFTLGFITMIMMGAIIQILPVIGGVGINHVKLIGKSSHACHTLGSSLLMLSFIQPTPLLKIIALACLLLGLLPYIIAVVQVLMKKLSQGATSIGMRYSIAALSVTLILGCLLVARVLNLDVISNEKHYTNLHLLWGLGWISLLIIAVSFQVIPMFFVAPSFPNWLTKTLPLALFSLLVAAIFVVKQPTILWLIAVIILLVHCVYAYYLLDILRRRKRRISDSTIKFWQLASLSCFILTLLFFIPEHTWSLRLQSTKSILLGAVYIHFFVIAIMLGMLLKIMPFLSFTHLQQRCLTNFSAMQYLPSMHEFINMQQGFYLYIIHILTGILLIVSIYLPKYTPLFALLLIGEFSWLGYLMVKTTHRYYQIAKTIDQLASNS